MEKKVLGFDSWTGGAAHFARIAPALKRKGYSLILLHIGSWGGDPDAPVEEKLGELLIRDIAFYKGKSLDLILEQEAPVAVVFLSNDVFIHRAFNRYCLLANIPTIHLYHGLHFAHPMGKARRFKLSYVGHLRFIVRHIPKAPKILSCYAHALIKSHASSKDWIRFLIDLMRSIAGKFDYSPAKDSRTMAACVYTQADIVHAIKKYGYIAERVHIVGNPDLIKFGIKTDSLCQGLSLDAQSRHEVVYITTGFLGLGLIFNNLDDIFEHLLKTRNALRKQNLIMSVKLHPCFDQTDIEGRLMEEKIEVLNHSNFVSHLQNAAAAIVEPSSLVVIPAILGIPVLLASYAKLMGQVYGHEIQKYPRAFLLKKLSDVSSLLKSEANKIDVHAIQAWITSNVGPLPAEQMPQRVAEVIELVVKDTEINRKLILC